MKRILSPSLGFLVALIVLLPGPAAPANSVDNSDICRNLTRATEKRLALPRHILAAIALAESGRWNKKRQEKTAWPWTVYAEGRGRYFETKAAALAEIKQLRARGVTNIDVGCMQINLYHHGKEFASLADALDPVQNVAYSGRLLKSLHRQTRSWSMAMGYYHSRTERFNRPYRRKVRRLWDEERNRAARERRAEALAKAARRRAARSKS